MWVWGVIVGLGIVAVTTHRTWLISPLMKRLAKALPPLSDTERVALEAGTVGFEKELFSGKPNWAAWQALPPPHLSEEEQAFLDGPVAALCRTLNDWQITHELADLPPSVWEALKRDRFFGMIIPKAHGGLGFSAQAHSAVLQKLASVSPTVSSTVAVPNSLGPAELILHYGTDAQKAHYLPRLARGEDIPCFALTGPTAGSDATSVPDVGVVVKEEVDGVLTLGLRLTLDKRYITLAPVATVIGVAFRLLDPDHLLGNEVDRGLTLALLPRNTPGLDIGRRHFPLNVPFQNGPIHAKDMFVPLSCLLGGPEQVGQGWRMLVECLSVGRAISLPSNAAGSAGMAAATTGAYARLRRQFGVAIGQFEGVALVLGRLTARAYATRALSQSVACAVDRGEKPAVSSAIAKYHTTEWSRQVVQDAMDIHGGKGIILGPNNYLGRAWEGAPIAITVEGANIMTRNLMIFGQGAIRCHPFVLEEMNALADPEPFRQQQRFERAWWGHVRHALGNASRAWAMAWFAESWPKRAHRATGPVAHHYHRLNRYAAALAWVAEISMMRLGGKLKRHEALTARLGDLLSLLYASAAVLRHHEAAGCPEEEQAVVQWWLDDSCQRMEQALDEAVRNFPARRWGRVLEAWVLPWGRQEKGPSDRLTCVIADQMTQPNRLRDRLLSGLHQEPGPHHPAGRVNAALLTALGLEPIEHKLAQAKRAQGLPAITLAADPVDAWVAQGIISAAEGTHWRQAQAEIQPLLAVDDFASVQLRVTELP